MSQAATAQGRVELRPCIGVDNKPVVSPSGVRVFHFKTINEEFAFLAKDRKTYLTPDTFIAEYPRLAKFVQKETNGSFTWNEDYILSKTITAPGGRFVLDVERNPVHQLFYNCLPLFNPEIGDSPKQTSINQSLYVYDYIEEAKAINSVAEVKAKCYGIMAKLSATDKVNYCSLFGYKVANMTAEIADSKLYTAIETKPLEFYRKCSASNIHIRLMVNLLDQFNVVERNVYGWFYKEVNLGDSDDAVLNYIISVKDASVVLNLKKDLEAAYKGFTYNTPVPASNAGTIPPAK